MAAQGGAQYTIGENLYLAKNASTLNYRVTITSTNDTWSYERGNHAPNEGVSRGHSPIPTTTRCTA